MKPRHAALLLTLAIVFTPSVGAAAESLEGCAGTINSVPAVISTQGVWCMSKDLALANIGGNAITVATNNVTIDCNGFKLGGLLAGAGTFARGIYTDRLNTVVRNCNVRGFYYGLEGSGSDGLVVEDSRFDGNTLYAMQLVGDGMVVRRNLVFDTGGSSHSANAVGIRIIGDADVIDNAITGVSGRDGVANSPIGIVLATGQSQAAGNRIRGLAPSGGGSGYGIFVTTPSDVRDTFAVGPETNGSVGIQCQGGQALVRGSSMMGFETAIAANCVQGADNLSFAP